MTLMLVGGDVARGSCGRHSKAALRGWLARTRYGRGFGTVKVTGRDGAGPVGRLRPGRHLREREAETLPASRPRSAHRLGR